MDERRTRNIVLRFWSLTTSQRREIAMKLGLIDEKALSMPEPERYGRALEEAGKRGLVEQLVQEIEKSEEDR